MKVELNSNRTMVGIPFYDAEGEEVLEACLSDVDRALNNLGVDAQIVVGINGPMTCRGYEPLSQSINRSKYNASVRFIKTLPGQVAALNQLACHGVDMQCERIFLTDADISRLPDSLGAMWTEGSKPLVGARYSAYPIELMMDAGIEISDEEAGLIEIFEADKHPSVRRYVSDLRPKNRVKGSLMLVDINYAQSMHGDQKVTPDSRMNFNIGQTDRQIVDRAGFMHYPRTSLTDHIQARVRHFRAASAEGRLDIQYRKELFPSPCQVESIAEQIIFDDPTALKEVSNLLLRSALRQEVAGICRDIADDSFTEWWGQRFSNEETDLNTLVHSFQEAQCRICRLLRNVNWHDLDSAASNGHGTTQSSKSRIPINLEPYMKNINYRRMIFSYLGVEEDK
ncbi:hypothetical protein JXA63_01060 [Candidatus Woesebacteria bacterium]|nr:hypothetical protein [Candidatus Woesebacteria bacterium]